MKFARALAVVVVAAAVGAAGACSNNSKVGNDKTLAFKEKEGNRLGNVATTTTTAAPATTARPAATTAPPTTARPIATTAPPTTAKPSSGTVTISITSQRYEPFAFSVKKGTTIKVVNNDSQPRTFTSDTAGQFDSGQIPPGGSWTYEANTVGKFNFHDETRPYVVGQMEVTA